MSTKAPNAEQWTFPWLALMRASALHVGAAATAAALRRELIDSGRLPSAAFDEAYAVGRVTPGTNLLAMYTLLGERLAGWFGALAALAIGVLVPSVVVVAIGALYVYYAAHPLAHDVMRGARAGALAVLVWAIIRLLQPQLEQHRRRGIALAIAALGLALTTPIPQFVILLIAAALGAAVLRAEP
jgi:chromate transporter